MDVQPKFSQLQTTALSLSPTMRLSLQVLHATSRGLSEIVEREVHKNPFLSVIPRSFRLDGDLADTTTGLAKHQPSLIAHLEEQMSLELRSVDEYEIARHFLLALEPSGWLGKSVETIAFESGCELSRAETVLSKLQQSAPAGIYARNLSECLRLQALDRGILSPTLETILHDLPLFSKLGPSSFARALNLSGDDVTTAAAKLKRLDPKPGLSFDYTPEPIFPPEVIVRKDGSTWVIALNDDAFPDIRINESHQVAGLSAKEIRDQLAAARNLSQAIFRRRATLLAVAEETIRAQISVLEHGPIATTPLSLRDVADALGVHISTVSRATNGCMVQTSKGTLPLRAFFSRSVRISANADTAYVSLLELVRQLIQSEDSLAPLSDQAVQQKMVDLGFAITVRSVNNHRKTLGFPKASKRRKYPASAGSPTAERQKKGPVR